MRALAVAALASSLAGAAVVPGGERVQPVRYGRDIRPVLSDRCFVCHGPDPGERKAELRLDLPNNAAIVAGSLERSELWARVTSAEADERMPPAASHKKALSPDELALVRRWIESGAEYEEHWAFVPPERPEVPAAADWARGELDAFVAAEQARNGIAPSPEADRATLLRRVFLDLTGLPPTPEELESFLADEGPEAYERWVERLLFDEPYVSRYAERMAVPWLDAARYADTSGIHMDAGRQIWLWRDWVLAALRDGMPFDQFLTEQLAGDLLPEATARQKVASGFNRNHVTTDEGGAIAAEYLVEYAVDRAATTGSVFLGMTMGCARCHDHKFDPISQSEFYSFYSYFNSIEEPGLYSQIQDANRAFEPYLLVPSPEQEEKLEELTAAMASERELLDRPIEREEEHRAAFFEERLARAGIAWVDSEVIAARSTKESTLTVLEDDSVLVGGENPDADEHVITLETDAAGLRLVSLEALTDASLPHADRVGRAPNGNAVLASVRAEAVSVRDPSQRAPVNFVWAWADYEQLNGDYRVVNVLKKDGPGWAVDAHNRGGPRAALLLAEGPFGFEGGTRLEVTLDYDSVYAQHVFGRVRLSLGQIAPAGLDALGLAASGWYSTARFAWKDVETVFSHDFGPEAMTQLDLLTPFGEAGLRFNYVDSFRDDRLNGDFEGGLGALYVAKRVFVPSAREVEVSIGSDDGFRIYRDGELVAENQVNRGVAVDQDRITVPLSAGEHTLLMKIVNTGGPAGYYWRTLRRENELSGALLSALLPDGARWDALEERLRSEWRLEFSPEHRARVERIAELEGQLTEARAGVPQTMVMKERDELRETFVLNRGVYDQPDEARPVQRGVPAALGPLPPGAPTDRRGLAEWLTSPSNPLVARVAVNRLWELCFGTGLVATSEDFGLQGEWPSHPALLDWLAVEYRESGWDTKALVRRIVTSSTYRQSSRVRPELAELDPGDRLLARYPRRRLAAEQIRDQALYVSGLLVEQFGGPSVKPYQPEGLWQEVAMLNSNTRFFERGEGDELWRRSLYTYWKRACPPPSMLTFDAPTREFCTIQRGETATPLQALVLWNDEQFFEAARLLAARTLDEDGADAERLARMFVRCAGRDPEADEAAALAAALTDFRARYEAAPEDAAALLEVGMAAGGEHDVVELAAWTMIANALFSLDAMICQG
jgi:mono/diheme cytochrome c family protein